MRSALIVATTVYHIFVAIQMKNTILKKYKTDIIIGDETSQSDQIAKRLRATGFFRKVYYVQMNDYNKKIGKYSTYTSLNYSLKRYSDVRSVFKVEYKYDHLFVPFFHHFHMNLYDYIKTFSNKNVKVSLYEEGLAIYRGMKIIYDKRVKEIGKDKIYRITKYGKMLNEIDGIVSFHPELLQWDHCCFKKKKIPPIDRKDDVLKKLLNRVFGYSKEKSQKISEDIIFFEEAKYEDGYSINDVSLVNEMASYFGKDNILVKLHPRSKMNRFASQGLKTYSDCSIPWEVIYLNNDWLKCQKQKI